MDFGVGSFHDFSQMNFGENEQTHGRTLTPRPVDSLQEMTRSKEVTLNDWVPPLRER